MEKFVFVIVMFCQRFYIKHCNKRVAQPYTEHETRLFIVFSLFPSSFQRIPPPLRLLDFSSFSWFEGCSSLSLSLSLTEQVKKLSIVRSTLKSLHKEYFPLLLRLSSLLSSRHPFLRHHPRLPSSFSIHRPFLYPTFTAFFPFASWPRTLCREKHESKAESERKAGKERKRRKERKEDWEKWRHKVPRFAGYQKVLRKGDRATERTEEPMSVTYDRMTMNGDTKN